MNQALRQRRHDQKEGRCRPGSLSKNCHPRGVPAKEVDIPVDPFQDQLLIVQPPVSGGNLIARAQEAYKTSQDRDLGHVAVMIDLI